MIPTTQNDQLVNYVDFYRANPKAPHTTEIEHEAYNIVAAELAPKTAKRSAEPLRLLESPELNIFGGERLIPMANRPKIDMNFLVKKLHITPNEIIRIIGNPNSGKTYVALEVAVLCILGLPLFALPELQTKFDSNKTVVFWQLEGGKQMTLLRLERIITGICESYGLNHEETFKKVHDRLYFQYMSAGEVAFNNGRAGKYSSDLAKQFERGAVGQLFIDNQTAILNTSGLSPNDPIARTLLDAFKDASNLVGHDVYTWFIHHFNKNNIDGGTHQFFAASGTELNVHWEKEKNKRWIEHHKSNFTLSDNIPIEFIGNGRFDEEMDFTRGLFIESKASEQAVWANEKEIVMELLQYRESEVERFGVEPYNKGALVSAITEKTKDSTDKISKGKAEELIQAMISSNEVTAYNGQNNAKLIRVMGWKAVK